MKYKPGEQHHKHLPETRWHQNQNDLSIKHFTLFSLRAINTRKKALQAEKERSAKVASLPPPPPNPIEVIFSPKDFPREFNKSHIASLDVCMYICGLKCHSDII